MNNIENFIERRSANELKIEVNFGEWRFWSRLEPGLGKDEDAEGETEVVVKVEDAKEFEPSKRKKFY